MQSSIDWRLLLAFSVLVKCDTEVCRPVGDKTVWVFCSHHKTGSVLFESILKDIDADIGAGHHRDLDTTLLYPEKQDRSFVDLSKQTKNNILSWKHVDFENPAALLAEGDDGTTSKVVIFLRDPMEIILSGYFYHLKTDEPWANEPFKATKAFEKACATGDRGDIAAMASCVALQMLPPVKNHTYRELLNSVDVPVGVFIEAVRDLKELEALRRTHNAFMSNETCHRAIFCFLDDVVDDMRSAFRDIFDFLGAEYVDHCVTLALKHDIKVLAAQKASAGQQFKHAMDQSMRPLRDALRLILKSTPWFLETINPIRADLGYLPFSTNAEVAQAPRRCRALCH